MTKPIIGAMAAALASLIISPGMARSDPKPPPAIEPNRIVEMPEGFAICTCGSSCSAQNSRPNQQEKEPASIRVGASVHLDPTLIAASATKGKAIPHAQ